MAEGRRTVARSDLRAAARRVFAAAGAIRTGAAAAGARTAGPGARMARGYGGGTDDGGRWLADALHTQTLDLRNFPAFFTRMRSPWSGTLIGRYNDGHPHWVVDYGCYAVTIRCVGSLPAETMRSLAERWAALNKVPARSEDAQRIRRNIFHTLDTTLDRGTGFAPFRNSAAAGLLSAWLGEYNADGLRLAAFVVMPNHVHLVTQPLACASPEAFVRTWRRFKARAARNVNRSLGRKGPLWQRSWYDRWIRDAAEWRRWVDYIARNPVKAELSARPEDYPYMRLGDAP
ncbi:MAG: transposase [Opitutales bacterium]|nr:transposase [Opitutales bacterium]